MFEVKIVHTITAGQMMDLLTGLFQDGYSSWLEKVKFGKLTNCKLCDFETGGKFCRELTSTSAIIACTPGCSIMIQGEHDLQQGSKVVEVGIEQIQNALELMQVQSPGNFNDIITENDDANTADILGQYLVYGEVVFG